MKRIFLSALALFTMLHSFGQTKSDTDTTEYKNKKLKIEEINLVSSYYSQNGNHAAVTGGIGSQELTDVSNTIDIKLIRYDRHLKKHIITGEVGFEHYTSASSDKIDLKANTSASYNDTRIYTNLNYSIENEIKRSTVSIGASSSTEFDYKSKGINIGYSKKTYNKNGEFTAKLQIYLDSVFIIKPTELRTGAPGDFNNYKRVNRNSFTASLAYSQIVNTKFQLQILADITHQKGYLSLPFHRVYFKDGSVHQELLPKTRTKLPLSISGSYYVSDHLIAKFYYRFYADTWGINAHTINLELPVRISPFFTVSPFYRYNTQTAANQFAPFMQHTNISKFYTSNYDLSNFNSSFFGAGIKYSPLQGVLGISKLNTVEIRYGHYERTNGLNANVISLNIKYK